MTKEEMYEVLNKGIPNYAIVELNTDTMIRECSSNQVDLINSINQIKKKYEDDIIQIMGYSKYRYRFFRDFRILTSYKNSETSLHVSPNTFLIRLKEIMGVGNASLDYNDSNLKQELMNRLEVLRNITTPGDLQKEFPIIYEDYLESIRIHDQLDRLKGNPAMNGKMNYQWRMYHAYGMSIDFSSFMSRQVSMYRNFIVRRQFVEGTCHRQTVDLSSFNGLDKTKFQFYVAYKYMYRAKSSRDLDEIQNCVYYLMAYFREERNFNLSIVGDFGEKVTYRKLLNDFRRLLGQYKELKPIDEERAKFKGYHVKHVINHINKYYGNIVNWFIVPNSSDGSSIFDGSLLGTERNVLSMDERNRRLEKRMQLYNQKIQFYENTGYVLKIFGWNEFNGYVCYVYPNGKIVMDKLFEDYIRCIPAKDEAIYSIEASDFDVLSKLNKKELQESGKAKRLYHAGAWVERTREIIESKGLEESIDAVKKLELRRNA